MSYEEIVNLLNTVSKDWNKYMEHDEECPVWKSKYDACGGLLKTNLGEAVVFRAGIGDLVLYHFHINSWEDIHAKEKPFGFGDAVNSKNHFIIRNIMKRIGWSLFTMFDDSGLLTTRRFSNRDEYINKKYDYKGRRGSIG